MQVTESQSTESPPILFDQALIERYDGRGPRYTSYPTALQFDDAVNAEHFCHNALASNASGKPLSLYVHIPFCKTLCYYCGCNKIVTRNQARVGRYLVMLHREIELMARLFDNSRQTEQLHLGGGTPTYLNDEQLTRLVKALDDAFHFAPADQREFSIEIDPRTVDFDGPRLLADLGFNRLSVGIQDFDPLVQEAINREQTPADVQRIVETARSAGFRSVSFDLIYGLPHQSVQSFDKTLARVLDMQPDRLAVYNYAHLPERFKSQRLIDARTLPAAAAKLEILHHTIDRLLEAGYVYIGMDHFARPDDDLVRARLDGTLQRNFQGYSTHRQCDLVSLGVSSISHIGDMYAQNAVSTGEYESILEDGLLPIKRGVLASADDRVRADVIQQLMCFDELRFATVEAAHEIEFRNYFADELKRLKDLEADGLVAIDADSIRIRPSGRLLLRSIAMVFDRYLDQHAGDRRFSRAI